MGMPVSRISVAGNSLLITFKYHPRLLNVIREVDGRYFNKDKRRWEVPVENVVECWDALKEHGFIADSEVLALYEKRAVELQKIADIKRVSAPYLGTLPLYDFQKTGAAFLRELPAALLADVPGLGKTLQVAAAFEDSNGQILVLVPASLKFNWKDELFKWLPKDRSLVIHGTKQERAEQWSYANKGMPRGNGRIYPKWVIANYELLLHDFAQIAQRDHEWSAIVCDEADRIANPFAKTTKALKMIRSSKRIALTGTPVSNTPEDLFSIIDWLYPRFLGSFSQFQKKYCKLHPEYRRVIGYQNLELLRERVDPIMLRRLKEDVLKDFPPKTVEYVKFDLDKDERKLYEDVKKMILEEIRKEAEFNTSTLGIVPVKMLRLKQCTDHPLLLGSGATSSKLQVLRDMLEPIIKSGEKAIIFTQFAQMAEILAEALKHFSELQFPMVITGGVDAQERKKIVDVFNASANRHILILTEAGTYGLNLQSATYVFHYDAPWSVSKIEQREGRAHRVGQDKPVSVYHLVANRSIDEYVLKVLSGKRVMSNKLLGDDVEEVPMHMTQADIEEILGGELYEEED